MMLRDVLKGVESYPFHMPGHKRNSGLFGFDGAELFKRDFTEITETDDLHHPTGILKERMEEAAKIYGVKKTYFLINGSTCGILAAISAAAKRRESIVIARNCHKSAYNAVSLKGLKPYYICPPVLKGGIWGGITPQAAEKAITESGAKAFVLVSPTYEGIVSDIKGISAVCRKHDCILIVDEAHGAHFRFCGGFPKSAAELGADVVIQSLHKTLPSLTQTALLHICSKRADAEKISRYLSIYQSSSPSYVLLEAIDNCIDFMTSEKGKSAMEEYYIRLIDFRRKAKGRILGDEIKGKDGVFDVDPSKIVIWGGTQAERAIKKEGIELEMANLYYCLALSSVGDSEEGFDRLLRAVLSLKPYKPESFDFNIQPKLKMLPCEAEEAEGELLPLEKSVGRVSKAMVYIYPPGSPIVGIGEEVTPQAVSLIKEYIKKDFSVLGAEKGILCVKA